MLLKLALVFFLLVHLDQSVLHSRHEPGLSPVQMRRRLVDDTPVIDVGCSRM